MTRDGDIDYSKYTLLELEEALDGISKLQYPQNYANLCSAYEQMTSAHTELPALAAAPLASDGAEIEPGIWSRLFKSRTFGALMGVACLWWSYDLFTRSNCPSGDAAIRSICEAFGHRVAAGIPLVLGLTSLALAALPKRSAGA
jgi:hypothetical protein